jgi:hypothetical protein
MFSGLNLTQIIKCYNYKVNVYKASSAIVDLKSPFSAIGDVKKNNKIGTRQAPDGPKFHSHCYSPSLSLTHHGRCQ